MKSFFSQEACNIILRLLDKDPDNRLGARDDADDIMNHPFFTGIDWKELERKNIDPLFKPDLTEDKLKYFNPNLEKQERVPVDEVDEDERGPYKSLEGFTYTNDSFKERRLNGDDTWGLLN